MDQSFRAYLDLLPTVDTGNPSFQASCLNNLRSVDTQAIQLVDRWGQVSNVSSFSNNTWGITTSTCYAHCSSEQVPYPFNYGQFVNAMTNYLLPWLALTAQLPFETGAPSSNLVAFCLAVGSPVLITYSLTLTILNRAWARQYFDRLKTRARGADVAECAKEFDKKISAMQFFLQESQQTAVRINSEGHWLASLIVLPKNIKWWGRLKDHLKRTRRGFSPSLVAQMSVAVTAYLLTVIAAFVTDLGDPNTALQLSSGELWIWLVPVIVGWVVVGTQTSDHAIQDALEARRAWRACDPPIHTSTTRPDRRDSSDENADDFTEKASQNGIECRGGLGKMPMPSTATTAGDPSWSNGDALKVQGYWGFALEQDLETNGPTYNYARVFAWWLLANTIGKATERTLDGITSNRLCGLFPLPGTTTQERTAEDRRPVSDSEAVAKICGLSDPGSIKQYLPWSDMDAQVYRHILVAAFAALFVQWGTAGDAIMTAYMTPTVGLGCRSGSYLLYASASTLAWLLLVVGMLFSHQAMLIYQARILQHPATMFQPSDDPNDPTVYERTSIHTLYCAAAVIFRVLGKTLCIVNTIWLLMTSLAELVGGFDNCWCLGLYMTKGDRGSVLLFKTAKDLARTAAVYWGCGLAMTSLVVFFAVMFFSLGSWKPDN